MKKRTAEEVLEILIDAIQTSLDELTASPRTEFAEGEIYAYIECLDIVKFWDRAEEYGLDYNPEEKYKIA